MARARRAPRTERRQTPGRKRERGQTLVEYTFIIGLVSLLVVVLAVFMDTPLQSVFQRVGEIVAQIA